MATRKPLVIIGGQIQELPAADAIDSASFAGTNWTDLTDGGTTTLHSHAGGSNDMVHIYAFAAAHG